MTAAAMTVQRLFDIDPSALRQADKESTLLEILGELTEHHWNACEPYRRILTASGLVPPFGFDSLSDIPALPVSLFKDFELRSIPEGSVARVLRSSGTTGQIPSKIYLDTETASLQTRALVRIFQRIIGKQRLPMILIDQNAVVENRRSFTARGAGVLGLANFGRDHTYLLDEQMRLNWTALDAFVERFGGQPVLLFGFTFMVWKYFIQQLEAAGRRIPFERGILIHSGGWKKLQDEAVSRAVFRERITAATGIRAIHDFYGMVEQVGSVFVECSAGALHAPVFADVIIRDVRTWESLGVGEAGVIQVLSALPRSYPGHSLLTEDMGELTGEDNCACGQLGRTFRVIGRVPKAELRGCSDTHAFQST